LLVGAGHQGHVVARVVVEHCHRKGKCYLCPGTPVTHVSGLYIQGGEDVKSPLPRARWRRAPW
jgi:hypothetical protein